MSYLQRTDQQSTKRIYVLNVRVFLEKLCKQYHVDIDTAKHAWKRFFGKHVRSLIYGLQATTTIRKFLVR